VRASFEVSGAGEPKVVGVPREVVALVSADDAVAAVRVHADRVHDLLRRSGCGAEEAVEVTESYAFALLDALVNAPETVGDMAGWWFGRALELGRRVGATAAEPTEDVGTSVLSGTTGEAQVRAGLAALPESERAAVVLRDAYDLPPQAVAVALRRDDDTAAALVAAGRLHLVGRYDDRPSPDLAAHSGRTPADLSMLSRLADGTLPHPRAVALRRHVGSCVACEDVLDALAKGRRLCAGLPVLAMPDEAREALLDRVAARSMSVLPSVDEVLRAIEEEDDDVRPAISPIIVITALVVALLLGVVIAALTRSGSPGSGLTALAPSAAPAPTAAFSTSPTPTISASRSASPRSTSSRTASAHPTNTSTALVVNPAIAISPASGSRGTIITVAGSGWAPGDDVAVRYTGPVSSSRASAIADKRGRFHVTISADGLVPGDYSVQASGSSGSTTKSFRQTS
jgi:DNA-directed RNA polymerase specialized sigma24 family protein